MGKSTISMAMFNSYCNKLPEDVLYPELTNIITINTNQY